MAKINNIIFLVVQIIVIVIASENTQTNSSLSDFNKLNIDLSRFRITQNGTFMTLEKIQQDQANEVLEQNLANLCSFGENPKLEEICPTIKIDEHGANLTLKFIESRIINSTIVKRLKNSCKSLTEWCIPESVTHLSNNLELTKTSSRSENVLCLFSSCYSSVKRYIKNCVKSELSRDVLSLGENICRFNNLKSTTNNYCTENTMRLIHMSVARHNLTQFEVNISRLKASLLFYY